MKKSFKEKSKTIVIGGAGPSGLTAAIELQKDNRYNIIVVEASNQVGGISKTIDFKGNKIDLGGHRFFSKSDKVLNWWQNFLPIISEKEHLHLTYQNKHKDFNLSKNKKINGPHFKVRPRLSRIVYNNNLFDYPVKVNFNTFRKFGIFKTVKILCSLIYTKLKPVKEKNLEDFYINRFGRELYATFFKEYTKKVWGVPCHEISASWGRQRVKDLSLKKIIIHYLKKNFLANKLKFGDKKVEQSLIEYFLYPDEGPGQFWDEVVRNFNENVTLLKNTSISAINIEKNNVNQIEITDNKGKISSINCDYFISSIPIKHLIEGIGKNVPIKVQSIARQLQYRDFMIIGLLLKDMKLKNKDGSAIKDNWLYVQNDDVMVGRVQLFHNWSNKMVKDNTNFWIGAEYFCNETDTFWNLDDKKNITQAIDELAKIDLIDKKDFIEGIVIRTKKAYPSYVGSYNQFNEIINYLNTIYNLFPVGRNGMHKYNNQDHSMLTAMEAANCILLGNEDKTTLWNMNTDDNYIEENTSQNA